MASIDEIAIKLGLKTEQLKTALADANVRIKAFKKEGESGPDDGLLGTIKRQTKSLNDLKNLVAGGAIAGAVKGFFQLAIDAAEKSKDATDTSAAAVRDFAKGLEEAKGFAGSFAVTTVGAFNKLGSAIGDVVNITRSFVQNGTQGFEVWAKNQDAIASSGAAAEAAEKHLAEVRKKNGDEFIAITKELKSIEERSQAQKLKGLDVYETERNLFLKLSELRQQLAHFDGDAIDKRKLILKIAQTQLDADEATLAVKKDQVSLTEKESKERADAAKKWSDEQDRNISKLDELNSKQEEMRREDLTLLQKQNEYLKEQAGVESEIAHQQVGTKEYNESYNRLLEIRVKLKDTEKEAGKANAEIAALLLRGEQNLSGVEKEKLKLLTGQTTEHNQQLEVGRLLAVGVANLTDAERERLAVLIGQTTEETKQTAELARQAKAAAEKAAADEKAYRFHDVTTTGTAYADQSTAALQGVLARLKATRESDRIANLGSARGEDSVSAAFFAQETARVQAELQSRAAVLDVVKRLGEDSARRQYGDTLTDKAMRDMNESTAKNTVLLSSIEQRLAASALFAAK